MHGRFGFVRELGRRTSMITHDPRETSFLLQRISVAVQKGNAASCAGTLPPVELTLAGEG